MMKKSTGLNEEQQRARALRDWAASMLIGYQHFTDGDYDFEDLLDHFEIDASHILKRIEKFREIEGG